MFYPEEVVADLRMNADIVRVIGSYVNLTPKGNYHFGLCPFHNEKSPSFSVTQDRQMYHCFGCNASGNVYTFIMQIERLNFKESIEFLANLIGYRLPTDSSVSNKELSEKNEIYQMHLDAMNLYKRALYEKDDVALNYLKNRNLDNNTIEKFSLGYATNRSDFLYNFLLKSDYDIDLMVKSGLIIKGQNGYFDRFYGRVIFPIFDTSNRVVGFGGRSMNDKGAKYLNSSTTPIFHKDRTLYGLNFAKTTKKNDFILVEGYLDVIKLHKFGFDNAIAALGTAFNQNHVRTISQYKKDVVVCFDNDEAGKEATNKAIKVLSIDKPNTKVLRIKDAKDPDEFLENFGVEKFQVLYDEKINYLDYLILNAKEKYDLNDTSNKVLFVQEAVTIIKDINNEITLDAYIKMISQLSGISTDAIKKEVNKSGNIASNDDVVKKISNNINQKSPSYNAKKSLITMMISNKDVFSLVHSHLEIYELNDDIFERLYGYIINSYKKNVEILLCDYLNFFETVDEQRVVSEIFNTAEEFLIDDKRKKAVTDLLKAIKKDYYNSKLITETDPEKIAILINNIKQVEKITL